MKTGYSVGEIMMREVQTIDIGAKIIDCAKKMADYKIGCLVVMDGVKVSGIITEQDLARKVICNGFDATTTSVTEIMSKDVKTTEPDRDIQDAVSLMGNNEIKHLPVIFNGKLKGIVTSKDIIQIQPGLVELLRFKSSSKNSNEVNNENDIFEALE